MGIKIRQRTERHLSPNGLRRLRHQRPGVPGRRRLTHASGYRRNRLSPPSFVQRCGPLTRAAGALLKGAGGCASRERRSACCGVFQRRVSEVTIGLQRWGSSCCGKECKGALARCRPSAVTGIHTQRFFVRAHIQRDQQSANEWINSVVASGGLRQMPRSGHHGTGWGLKKGATVSQDFLYKMSPHDECSVRLSLETTLSSLCMRKREKDKGWLGRRTKGARRRPAIDRCQCSWVESDFTLRFMFRHSLRESALARCRPSAVTRIHAQRFFVRAHSKQTRKTRKL